MAILNMFPTKGKMKFYDLHENVSKRMLPSNDQPHMYTVILCKCKARKVPWPTKKTITLSTILLGKYLHL